MYEAAAEVMRKVETARSTWGEHHVKAEIERFVSHHRDRRFTVTDAGGVRELDRGDVERMLLRTTLQLDSIPVTPEHVHGRFRPLTRADGESLYTSKGRTLYTSTRILEAEARLLSAARQESVTAAPVDAATSPMRWNSCRTRTRRRLPSLAGSRPAALSLSSASGLPVPARPAR